MTPAATTAGDRRWRTRHLPPLLAVSGVVLVIAAAAGWFIHGTAGAIGVAAGVAVVAIGYVVSTLVLAWADSVGPALLLPLGLMTYIVKLTVIGGILAVAAASGWTGLVPMAIGIVVGVVAWTSAQIWWVVRHPPAPPAAAAAVQAPPQRAARSPVESDSRPGTGHDPGSGE